MPEPATLGALRELAEAVRPTTLAAERRLPVATPLQPLLPHQGLQRGTTVAVDGTGATSLTLALASEASKDGSWVGFVGAATLGWAAVADAGIDLARTLVVTDVPTGSWATATAALVDAVDLVVISPSHSVRAQDGRRLAARARERGAVLIVLASRFGWPLEPDVRLTATHRRWTGVGQGHGRLTARSVLVAAEGRRAAARQRRVAMWLPSVRGVVAVDRSDAGTIDEVVEERAAEAATADVLPWRARSGSRRSRAG